MPACRNLHELELLLEGIDEEGNELQNNVVRNMAGFVREEPFFRGANGMGTDRCLFWTIPDTLVALPDTFDLFMDGTFKAAPLDATQLVIFQADVAGRCRPFAFALMKSRTAIAYKNVFNLLEAALRMKKPLTIIGDFEAAPRKSAKEVWPEITFDDCYFHFCQANRRKASQTPLLASKIRNPNSDPFSILRLFYRLALLPVDRIDAGFDAVKKEISIKELDDDFRPFISYFLRTWMKFPGRPWAVGHRFRRTNCCLEGYNHYVNLSMTRTGIYDFLGALLIFLRKKYS